MTTHKPVWYKLGMLRFTVLLVLIGLLGLGSPEAVLASCGLHGCPGVSAAPRPAHSTLAFQTLLQSTAFDFESVAGDYRMATLRVDYTAHPTLLLSAFAPWVRLDREGDIVTGFANPVAAGEWNPPGSPVSLGLQVELPFGNSDDGIAPDHFEILPYVSHGIELSARSSLSGWIGYRASLDSEDDLETDPSGAPSAASTGLSFHSGHNPTGNPRELIVVNPHVERELTWRAGFTTLLQRWNVTPALHVEGQWALRGADERTHYTFVDWMVGFPLRDRMQVSALARHPLGSSRRFDSTWSLGMSAAF